jgi:hypothetical protein
LKTLEKSYLEEAMINWLLSIICIVLLVLIVHRLLGAMHWFDNLQTALNDPKLAEPSILTDAGLKTSSLLSSPPTLLNSDHPTTTSLTPADTDDAKPIVSISIDVMRLWSLDTSRAIYVIPS